MQNKNQQEIDPIEENLFLVVNGYSGYESLGMRYEFRWLPVVLLDYIGIPESSSSGNFYFERCSLLMLGERVEYEKCTLKLIKYSEKIV